MRTRYKRTLIALTIALVTIGSTLIFYSNYVPTRIPSALFQFTETIKIGNNGTEPLEFGGISMETFLDFGWQKPYIVQVDHEYDVSRDKDGNPIIMINGPPELKPNQTYSATVVYEIETFPRRIPTLSVEESGKLGDIPELLYNYTKIVPPWWSPPDIRLNNTYWMGTEYRDMTVREVAEYLRGNSDNVLEIVLKDAEWINLHIDYYSAEPTYPIETAKNGRGDCDDQSNLLISLLRLQGIPSFLMMGQVYLVGSEFADLRDTTMDGHFTYEVHNTMGHAWVMIYVPRWGWLPCDPVTASSGSPELSITRAYALSESTIVFKNLTGVSEAPDYIGSFRNETREAKEKGIYFWLVQDMEQVTMPIYRRLFQFGIFILYTEVVCFAALVVTTYIYDRRRAERIHIYPRAYCVYCGTKNPVDAVYCGQCGQRIKTNSLS